MVSDGHVHFPGCDDIHGDQASWTIHLSQMGMEAMGRSTWSFPPSINLPG